MSKPEPLYNSRIIDTYIKLIRQRYPTINVAELLTYAEMKSYEVADQGHWFSQEQVDRFYQRLVEVSGNPQIAREAGRFCATPEAIGLMRQYILGMLGPANAFQLLKQTASNFIRSSVYDSKRIGLNKVEIIVTQLDGAEEKHFQCENRIGSFEAFVSIFDYKCPEIEHPECMFKGGQRCRYIVSWDLSLSMLLKQARLYLLVLLLLIVVLSYFFDASFTMLIELPAIAFILLILGFIIEREEKKEILKSFNSLKTSSDGMIEQVNANYKNALLTHEVGKVISKHIHVNDILDSVINVLRTHLDYERGLILLANPERTQLIFTTGFGYSEEQQKLLLKTNFRLNRPESKGPFVVSFREKKPLLIDNLNEVEHSLSIHSLAIAKKLGTHSFICCPIIYEQEAIGILAVDNLKSKRSLVQSDMSLLMGIAPVIGISIRNAELMQGRVKQFTSILEVLAVSIDARDSLTAGHSVKVTEYAVGICDELGLPDDYREMIRVAALLHDYGKIGIPDSILKKEGKLDAEEYNIVKSHAVKTREILEKINFEGILKQVPEVAGAHHEKIDGSGYPNGLASKDIPFGAKIIAVADFFEAITAKRHYRDPMPIDVALALLEEESGTHFERKIVNAMISYHKKMAGADFESECIRASALCT